MLFMASLHKSRILIVGAFPPIENKIFGGVVTSCKALVNSSFSHKFELILIDSTQISNPPPSLLKRAVLAGFRFIYFCKQITTLRPDAVILFAALGASIVEKGVMAWFSRLFGIPVLFFPRGAELIDIAASSIIQRLWIRWACRGATYFLCQGPAWQRFALEIIGFDLVHAPVVPNWTATNNLLAIGKRREKKKLGHITQLLFLGWLEKEKGIFELLQACSVLAAAYSFRLTIAGRGHAEDDARKFIQQSDLSSSIQFVGWVQGEALEQLLADSDVLILPSWAEGLPNAMIEAMAAGLAVVVSAVGNVPDIVTDGQEALLVLPKRVDLLQRAIQRLLEDPDLREAIAARGHAFVEKHYAVEPAIEVLSKVIMAAIKSRKPIIQHNQK